MPGITVFLPCRAGSTRVPDKNTRPFAGHDGGLLGLKLDQLERLAGIDCVIVDSNDLVVLERAEDRRTHWKGHAALEVRARPDALGRSATTTDALIGHALDTVDARTLMWTHVTSPMMDARAYAEVLDAWHGRDPDRHDSLMTVTPLRAFLWDADGPLSYRRDPVRWPRTQDIAPIYEVSSGAFLVPMDVGRRCRDRIGERPLLHPVSRIMSLDVDWEDDFLLAEAAYRALTSRD